MRSFAFVYLESLETISTFSCFTKVSTKIGFLLYCDGHEILPQESVIYIKSCLLYIKLQ